MQGRISLPCAGGRRQSVEEKKEVFTVMRQNRGSVKYAL